MENNNDFLSELGMKIKVAKVVKRTSTAKICKFTGLNKSTILQIENGQKNFHILTIKSIAESLGMDIKEFL